MMDKRPLHLLTGVIAGFALIRVPLVGFLAPLAPLMQVVGMVSVLIFSIALIVSGLLSLTGKKSRYL